MPIIPEKRQLEDHVQGALSAQFWSQGIESARCDSRYRMCNTILQAQRFESFKQLCIAETALVPELEFASTSAQPCCAPTCRSLTGQSCTAPGEPQPLPLNAPSGLSRTQFLVAAHAVRVPVFPSYCEEHGGTVSATLSRACHLQLHLQQQQPDNDTAHQLRRGSCPAAYSAGRVKLHSSYRCYQLAGTYRMTRLICVSVALCRQQPESAERRPPCLTALS
jgi:hypothetical protein